MYGALSAVKGRVPSHAPEWHPWDESNVQIEYVAGHPWKTVHEPAHLSRPCMALAPWAGRSVIWWRETDRVPPRLRPRRGTSLCIRAGHASASLFQVPVGCREGLLDTMVVSRGDARA